MRINLLADGYKNSEEFYALFLDNTLLQSSFVSEEYVNIPEKLPDFPIFFAKGEREERRNEFCKMIKIIADHVICLDRDISMDERFWHSWLCLYKRDYLLDTYPQIREDYNAFQNIVLKKLDWENYIYKAILLAQYVEENTPADKHESYYQLIVQNMDMFNYIIKYEIFRNGQFLINIMDIIAETGLSSVLKAKIKGRSDLGKDERYGRRVIFELNKAYPIVMGPMLEKETLKEYFLKYLGYYYDGNEEETEAENEDDFEEEENEDDF